MAGNRGRIRAAVLTVVVAVVAGCGAGDRRLAADPRESATSGAGESRAPTRVSATFGASPITYAVGQVADRATISYLNGRITMRMASVEFMLGFRVQEDRRDDSELLATNLDRWRSEGIRPNEVQVDGVTGYWHERELTETDEDARPGTRRFYVAAKGAVTVTLTMHVPEDVDRVEQARELADRLFLGVRFDESVLTSDSSAEQATPKVPFTFEQPAVLAGQNDAEFGFVYWTRYEFGDRTVEVSMQTSEDAAAEYREKVAALAATKATVLDVKQDPATASTVGRQVDEGSGVAARHNGGVVLMYFVLRKGDQLVYVRADGHRQPLAQSVQDAVGSIVSSMRFTS